MSGRTFKIAVAGSHSTGKTTFLRRVQEALEAQGVRVEYVHDSAADARDLGFPILTGHTFESTAWLMARAIELETVASLHADVILIDRPVHDALGYLLAALRHSGRTIDKARLERLERICEAWAGEYDLVFQTQIDASVPLGPGRDPDLKFRAAAAAAVAKVIGRFIPSHHMIDPGHVDEALQSALAGYSSWRAGLER